MDKKYKKMINTLEEQFDEEKGMKTKAETYGEEIGGEEVKEE